MVERGDADRTDLGRSFLALRGDAGLTQLAVIAQIKQADRVTLSQTQLSRIERGASLPAEAEADELGRLYGLGAARRAELVERVKDARSGVRDSRLVIQRGSTLAMQQRWRRLERESELVRAYQPAMVLGVLQTAAYASVVLRRPESSEVVRDRLLRHERLLLGPKPAQVLIQTEGSLRFTVGSVAVMREQLDALIEASRRPHVRLGVIPAARAVHRVTPNAFHLYDRTVVVGVKVAAAILEASEDVAQFEELFAEMEWVAVFGDEVRVLLRRIADDHRG